MNSEENLLKQLRMERLHGETRRHFLPSAAKPRRWGTLLATSLRGAHIEVS